MLPNAYVKVQENFTLPSDYPGVEIGRRNKTLDYVWNRTLEQLSEAEVLELAPFKEHIEYFINKYPELATIALMYLNELITHGSSQTLARLQASLNIFDLNRQALGQSTIQSTQDAFEQLDELLLKSEIVTTGMVPYYQMVVNRQTASSSVINVREITTGRRFTQPQYNYALQMIFAEVPEEVDEV